MSDLDLDSKSFDELTELFSAELTNRPGEAATTGELAIVWDTVRAQDAFIIEMSKRLETLERRPAAKWCGTFVDGKAYAECSFVTDQGSMWFAERDTAQRPGAPNSGWRLCVKRGAR
jgi:hypothetical protein